MGLGKKREQHARTSSNVAAATDSDVSSPRLGQSNSGYDDITTTTVTASTTAATLESEAEVKATTTNNGITNGVETATSGSEVIAMVKPATKAKKSHNDSSQKKKKIKQRHEKDLIESSNDVTTTTTTTTTTPLALKQRQYRHRVRTNSQTYLLERQLSEGAKPSSFTEYCENLMSTQAPVDHLKTYGLGTEMLDSVDALEPFEASVMTGFFGCSEADHQTHVALWVLHNRSLASDEKLNTIEKFLQTLEARVMALDGTVEERARQQREDFRAMRSVYKDEEIQRLKSALEKEDVKQSLQNARLESLEKILQTLLSNSDLDNQSRLYKNGSTTTISSKSHITGNNTANSASVLNNAKDNLKRTLSTALSDFDDSQ